MLHEPVIELGKDNSIEKKTKLGIILFWVYCIVYAGFVVIGTLSPKTLGLELLSGVNIAIIYGMGLIILAAVMGLIYDFFCSRYEKLMNKED